MPRGKTTRVKVALTAQEHQTLLAWQRSTTLSAGQARRGRLLLLLAAGHSITEVAARVGIARRHIYKWARRFAAQGLAGLVDLPRPAPAHRLPRAAAREEEGDGA
jgi:transposase